jgi:hypothetical protein
MRPGHLRAGGLVAAGVPGVLSLLLVVPAVPDVPPAALLVNPALLLVLGAVAGTWAAAHCGHVLVDPAGGARRRAGEMLLVGALGLAMAVADHALRALWQTDPGRPPSLVEGWALASLVVGILYGGIVEEIVMRWGLLSLLVLGLWRTLARRAPRPPAAAIVAAVAIAAAVFALGHLPALASAGGEPTAGAVVRTLVLNAVAGVVFGTVFVRRDLVAAMLAHGGAHAGFALAGIVI